MNLSFTLHHINRAFESSSTPVQVEFWSIYLIHSFSLGCRPEMTKVVEFSSCRHLSCEPLRSSKVCHPLSDPDDHWSTFPTGLLAISTNKTSSPFLFETLDLSSTSLTIPWSITNRYYTADVHFAAHTLESVTSHHVHGVPAVIFVWADGEVRYLHSQ